MTELVKVGSEGKYIDLMVDWSFKKIFGTEVNKDILIEFLKVIFPPVRNIGHHICSDGAVGNHGGRQEGNLRCAMQN